MPKLYSFDSGKQKKILVGEVAGDTLFKKVDPSKHFMRIVDGYGIQVNALETMLQNGITKIVIKETTGKEWEVKTEYWKAHAKEADYGNGRQSFLSLKFMNWRNKPKAEEKPKEPEQPKQTSLF